MKAILSSSTPFGRAAICREGATYVGTACSSMSHFLHQMGCECSRPVCGAAVAKCSHPSGVSTSNSSNVLSTKVLSSAGPSLISKRTGKSRKPKINTAPGGGDTLTLYDSRPALISEDEYCRSKSCRRTRYPTDNGNQPLQLRLTLCPT